MSFIENIVVYIKKYAPQYGIEVISAPLAQAILESNSGQSELAKNAHNYFGLKYNPNQPKRCPSATGTYTKVGSEQNADGTYTSSTMLWQKFPSMEAGVKGYFDFLNYTSRYNNLKGVKDPQIYLENIKADGYATSIPYVKNLMAVINKYDLTKYDKNLASTTTTATKLTNTVSKGGNSGLISCTILSPNHSGLRTEKISKITIHHMAGVLSAESCGNIFAKSSRQASSNYGIGNDGRIGMYVEEKNRSWCSSSNWNDQRAITIEVSNSAKGGEWPVSSAAYNSLIKLCVDICRRNDITPSYDGTKNASFTEHRMFSSTLCPGPYLHNRMSQIVEDVKKELAASGTVISAPVEETSTTSSQVSNAYPATPFLVEVLVSDLTIRKSSTADSTRVGVTGKGKFTITEVKHGYGKLKSGVGYIPLNDPSCVKILSSSSAAFASYIVKITTSALNIRKGPGVEYAVVNVIKGGGKYTIVEENNGWGLLKSYSKNRDGWINLKYTEKV